MDAPEDAFCPQCEASEPEREFRTAPGIKSPDTSFNDRTIKSLAQGYGLSDVSNKDGRAAKRISTQGPAPEFSGDHKILSRLGQASDNASPLLPFLRQAGGPRNWRRTPLPK